MEKVGYIDHDHFFPSLKQRVQIYSLQCCNKQASHIGRIRVRLLTTVRESAAVCVCVCAYVCVRKPLQNQTKDE